MEYLENQGIAVSKDEKEMVVRFLQNPLIFQLLAQCKIKIGSITPKSIYESYFKYLQYEIQQILDMEINLISTFDIFAYDMVEKGIESFSLEAIEKFLSDKVPELDTEKGKTLINWLIDVQQLIPVSLKNVSFFHQTITEFLAAHFLANEFKKNTDILKEKLQYMRWNYILLFAISFLSEEQAEKYIDILLQTDSFLAVQSCSYVEQGGNQLITKVLEHFIKNSDIKNLEYQIELEELLRELPVAKIHQDLIRRLMEDKNIIGGAAAGCLLRACGDCVKNELLDEMFQNLNDKNAYNYLSAIGEALSKKISPDDYRAVVLRLGRINIAENEEEDASVSGFDTLAQYLPLPQVVEIFQSVGRLNILQQQLLVDILKDENSQEGFDICINLIRQGLEEAVFPLYMYVKFNNNICLDSIDDSFIQHLNLGLQGKNKRWIVALIHALYQRSQPFARGIRSRLKQSRGIARLTYLYAIGKNRKKSFFSDYCSMLYYKKLPADLIGAFDEVDWEEELDHIIEFLIDQNRLQELSKLLCGNFDKTRWYYLSLTTLLTLVRVIEEIEGNKVIDDDAWIKYSIGKFMSKYVHKQDLLNLYHISNERIQRFFNFFVLNYVEDLNLKDFSELEIDFMLEDIKYYSFEKDVECYDDEILLSNISDEEFALKRLKPLLNTDNVILQENIKRILEKAGESHLRRYIER